MNHDDDFVGRGQVGMTTIVHLLDNGHMIASHDVDRWESGDVEDRDENVWWYLWVLLDETEDHIDTADILQLYGFVSIFYSNLLTLAVGIFILIDAAH